MFIGNEHLTYDPWIWLKVTFLSSTASVLKDVRISLEIPSFYLKKSFFQNGNETGKTHLCAMVVSQMSIANEHTDIFFIA